MRKKTKLLLWMGIAAGLVYAACRKMDRQTAPPGVTKEEKFFTFRKASDPLVQAITDYMQRQNEKLHYVEKTVSQIGYPYWDKAVVADTHAGAERGASGTSNIIYVPFVRDSENFVNASLIIHATAADTSFSYLCDWQYSDIVQTGLPKKAAALTMIRLDNAVFGNRLFQLTDSSLFGRSAKYMKLGSVTNNRSSLAGKPNTQAYVYSYTICWTEWEDQFEGQLHSCVPGPTCFEYNEVNSCLEISWTVGGDPSAGGGGGTGGSGTSGGGGSGSPGTGTPPPSPCGQTGGLRPGTATPCGAGWVPLPDGNDTSNPNQDPCTAEDINSGTIATSNYTTSIKPTSLLFTPFDPNNTSQPEECFRVDNIFGTFIPSAISTLPTTGGSIPGVTANTVLIAHTHPYGGVSAPSVADFFNLGTYGPNFQASYVIAYDGVKYAMVVNDYIKLQQFVTQYPDAVDPVSGDFDQSSLLYTGVVRPLMSILVSNQGYSIKEAALRVKAFVMKAAGITLTKANNGSDDFKKIGIRYKRNPNGTIMVDENNIPIFEKTDCM